MIGAIIGDIAGSRFEFNNYKAKNIKLFGGDDFSGFMKSGRGYKYDKCTFTDDSVMTIALADALLKLPNKSPTKEFEKKFKDTVIDSFKLWGQRYPNAGYGARFISWVLSHDRQPYNSFGNGSAMRVSPVIWYADSIEEAETFAKWSAEVTHNHPEGIKGAVVTAVAGYMARTGSNKLEIGDYVRQYYPTAGTRHWQDIAAVNTHVETCMNALPIAMNSFIQGKNYEDVIKEAIACGGDSDTIAAIAGAVAEAYYKVDANTMIAALRFLPNDLKLVVAEFMQKYNRTGAYSDGRS